VCDAYTVIREGRVVWDGTAAQLVAQAPGSAYGLHTSDDARALQVAAAIPGVRAGRSPRGHLAVTVVQEGSLDALVLALGEARVAVRRLELVVSPLESMFFALSGDAKLHELEPDDLAERVFAGAGNDA
jgi:ABC-type uncharacterized transport system ATPase subunit